MRYDAIAHETGVLVRLAEFIYSCGQGLQNNGHFQERLCELVRSFKHVYGVTPPEHRDKLATDQLGGDWTVEKDKWRSMQDEFDSEWRPLLVVWAIFVCRGSRN